MRHNMPPKDRVRAMVAVDGRGCWIWQGTRVRPSPSRRGAGYGKIRVCRDGKRWTHYAHRFAFEAFVGPIAGGLHVLHRCPGGGNPSCVNPEHLYLGTDRDNALDREREGRGNGVDAMLAVRGLSRRRT